MAREPSPVLEHVGSGRGGVMKPRERGRAARGSCPSSDGLPPAPPDPLNGLCVERGRLRAILQMPNGLRSGLIVDGQVEVKAILPVPLSRHGAPFPWSVGFEVFDLGIPARELRHRDSRVLVFPPAVIGPVGNYRSAALRRFGTTRVAECVGARKKT